MNLSHSGTADIVPLAMTGDMMLLQEAARGFLAERWPAHAAVAGAEDPTALRRIWRAAAAQGWTSLSLEAETGGLRLGLVLLQELGRAACPIPLVDAILTNTVLDSEPRQARAFTQLRDQLQTGEAMPVWVFGPASGETNAFDIAVSETADGLRLRGRAAFIENATAATHLIVVTARDRELAIVPIDAPGISVRPTAGLSVPPLAEIDFNDVRPAGAVLTSFNLADAPRLGRLALAARSLGAAARGLELLADYAKVREQFGQKIGQFQAIQHKLANCLIGVETCRLALLRAALADTSTPAGWTYPATVAVACAGQALRQVCLELHHGFGGVSFWEDHEMPRHFRRIHADLVRLGGVHEARREIADALLGAAI